jgi:hypothetical protein
MPMGANWEESATWPGTYLPGLAHEVIRKGRLRDVLRWSGGVRERPALSS